MLNYKIILYISTFGSVTTFLFGGWQMLMMILSAFVIIDYITGLLASAVEGKLSSKIGLKGITKKVFIFTLVAVAHLIDQILGTQHLIRDGTIIFYLCNETLSIIENAGRVGLPIPNMLVKAVEVLRKKEHKNSND